MQNQKINKKIQYVLNRRINSTIKLDKLVSHEERIEKIKENLNSYDKHHNYAKYSNQSFNRNTILPQVNLIPSKSTQSKLPKLEIGEPVKLAALADERKKTNRLNSQQVEQVPKYQRQRIPTSPNGQKQQSQSQRTLKTYLSSLLLHHYDPNLQIYQQISEQIKQIRSVWWNLVITLLSNLIKSIKNIQLCSHLATAYLHIEEEVSQNQSKVLKIFEDQHHRSLISQVFYFEKVFVLIVLTAKHQLAADKNLSKWLVESIRYIIDIKKFMLDIILENQQHFLRHNKLKKPSYLIRQKKLIQINRIMNQIKQSFNRIKKQSYSAKFSCFQLKSPCPVDEKKSKISQLKMQLLQIPEVPFISFADNPNKQYLIVLNPQHIFFEQDKKNTCIRVKPQAEIYLSKLSAHCQIVLFFHRRIKNMHPFLQEIDHSRISKVLDSSYCTYKQTKKIIDLNKFGFDVNKIIVVDVSAEKWSPFGKESCIIYKRQAKSTEVVEMFQKLLSLLESKQGVREIVSTLNTFS